MSTLCDLLTQYQSFTRRNIMLLTLHEVCMVFSYHKRHRCCEWLGHSWWESRLIKLHFVGLPLYANEAF